MKTSVCRSTECLYWEVSVFGTLLRRRKLSIGSFARRVAAEEERKRKTPIVRHRIESLKLNLCDEDGLFLCSSMFRSVVVPFLLSAEPIGEAIPIQDGSSDEEDLRLESKIRNSVAAVKQKSRAQQSVDSDFLGFKPKRSVTLHFGAIWLLD
ncbi:unnamed protein product [Notodromas monacha]|uniref:Uncharacterized protein n=1 Tax=Notodromas monacha TaxID=399045 RepID=A0A7R9GI95_9CRUS|nr:unnamed protein product [Notodromas monacha]CAG0922201.1 unnamed protein product [Notodromas monacha]